MYIDYTPGQQALREELRTYFAALMTPELRAELAGSEGGTPLYTKALRKMGKDGWLGIGWPKEFGGQGRSPFEQYVFFDEVQRAQFPFPLLTLNTVGPTLMKFGTDEQKATLLPAILRGECHFAIGYSEPAAGTDLASLKTRAVREGDEYVINGQKVFTSLADYADYIWLAARTDPDAPKHKGISLFLVPTKTPGFSLTKIHTLGENTTTSTYYENVRIPVTARVGRENEGWKIITTQLNHERISLMSVAMVGKLTAEVLAWAKDTKLSDGRRVIDQPWAQLNLARCHAMVEALKLMNWRQVWNLSRAHLDPAEASTIKVYGSEAYVKIYALLLEVIGPAATIKKGPDAVLAGRVEMLYRTCIVLTFGGGTNEVQRDIIATVGLGMPRSPR
jgi:alkylation response protein AidB-like acyl-CoA dehydrogenase